MTKKKTTAPKKTRKAQDVGALVVERMRRSREAVRATTFMTREAAIVEWLCGPDDLGTVAIPLGAASTFSDKEPPHVESPFDTLRERLPHGLNGVDDESLAKVRSVVRGITEALEANDRDGLELAAGFFYSFFQIGDQGARIRRAVQMVEVAARSEDPSTPAMLLFQLGPLDERFLDLDRAFVAEALARVQAGEDATKGGRGKTSPKGALAKLMVECGAFGATAKTARKKIDDAHGVETDRRTGRKAASNR